MEDLELRYSFCFQARRRWSNHLIKIPTLLRYLYGKRNLGLHVSLSVKKEQAERFRLAEVPWLRTGSFQRFLPMIWSLTKFNLKSTKQSSSTFTWPYYQDFKKQLYQYNFFLVDKKTTLTYKTERLNLIYCNVSIHFGFKT